MANKAMATCTICGESVELTPSQEYYHNAGDKFICPTCRTSHACKQCGGTGEEFDWRENARFRCPKCKGTGIKYE